MIDTELDYSNAINGKQRHQREATPSYFLLTLDNASTMKIFCEFTVTLILQWQHLQHHSQCQPMLYCNRYLWKIEAAIQPDGVVRRCLA
jgi:hypothetical protein